MTQTILVEDNSNLNTMYSLNLNIYVGTDVIIKNSHIDAIDLFPDNWLYIHSEDLQVGRITNFRNWVPQLYGKENKSILALEY